MAAIAHAVLIGMACFQLVALCLVLHYTNRTRRNLEEAAKTLDRLFPRPSPPYVAAETETMLAAAQRIANGGKP